MPRLLSQWQTETRQKKTMLGGIRISDGAAQHGIFIRNGKKFAVK